ncbi:hypothetical protein THERMOT_684 [Bathymodiolus thermophilus thioautotrophic gill symbiont]|uniref:Uncharacterized protein n=1 Tax=Bathymodiolus thermophilus thioautotrophic gill symbiont TaxID=2360 RepID=A0A8H8XEN7_9GAMM|nr:hypothetical protein THERMOT_684 [Bathymodiolus thermophilus thioautotrophic gill symbiont]CAB5504968.1 hypothetical protein THERMOS_2053 [Bathymodiolus thermophilus thioautotrophic gill symbiont]
MFKHFFSLTALLIIMSFENLTHLYTSGKANILINTSNCPLSCWFKYLKL